MYVSYCIYVGTIITFGSSAYSIDEDGGTVHPYLVISNPTSFRFDVYVLAVDDSATGNNYLSIIIKMITVAFTNRENRIWHDTFW